MTDHARCIICGETDVPLRPTIGNFTGPPPMVCVHTEWCQARAVADYLLVFYDCRATGTWTKRTGDQTEWGTL